MGMNESSKRNFDHLIQGTITGTVFRDAKKVRITSDIHGHLTIGCTRVTRQALENLMAMSNRYKGLPPEGFLAQEGE